jgi:hypothetical protein
MNRTTSTRAIVWMAVGAFLLFMSAMGIVEASHTSAKIFYGVLIPVSAGLLAYGIRSRRQASGPN